MAGVSKGSADEDEDEDEDDDDDDDDDEEEDGRVASADVGSDVDVVAFDDG